MSKKIIQQGDIILSQKILEELPKKNGSRIRRFKCECMNCGKVSEKYYSNLLQCKTGCNCTHSNWKNRKKQSKSDEEKIAYRTWYYMKYRCYNPKIKCFHLYGGKGITVCDEWKESFDVFYRDMGPRQDGMSLDRIDGTKGYCKENCRWANKITQNNNRNNVIFIEGVSLKKWCLSKGLLDKDYLRIHRAYRKGLSVDKIIENYS